MPVPQPAWPNTTYGPFIGATRRVGPVPFLNQAYVFSDATHPTPTLDRHTPRGYCHICWQSSGIVVVVDPSGRQHRH